MRNLPQTLLAIAAALFLYLGWHTFWFLTDDAFIAFRYVSNSLAGHGWVWNPPPFLPVEGYTSFLWVVLLDVVWRVTGVAPPESANWLSLLFGYGSLFISFRMVARLDLGERLEAHRTTLLALVLLGMLSNRTFLTWLSSGLETALFNFLLLWWIQTGIAPRGSHDARWLFVLSTTAAGVALTRPDGYLAVAASGLIAAHHVWRVKRPVDGLFALPLLAVPIHILWRHMTYGEWLPNTYFAKHVRPWPESGVRYLYSFVLEYGVYVWILLLIAWLLVERRHARDCVAIVREHFALVMTLATLVAHISYYTFRVGGDHFEYRVYSYLVPLLFVSSLWLISQLTQRAVLAHALLASFVLVSWPIQWVHYFESSASTTRMETISGRWPIAQHFPGPLEPIVSHWDEVQAWLIKRAVCSRHQEHKIFQQVLMERWPDREVGAQYSWEERPVIGLGSVGVASWVLPNVAVIDELGLNDRVTARRPLREGGRRLMAHDRRAPHGYVACFKPSLQFKVKRGLSEVGRASPLTDAQIRACETRAWY